MLVPYIFSDRGITRALVEGTALERKTKKWIHTSLMAAYDGDSRLQRKKKTQLSYLTDGSYEREHEGGQRNLATMRPPVASRPRQYTSQSSEEGTLFSVTCHDETMKH